MIRLRRVALVIASTCLMSGCAGANTQTTTRPGNGTKLTQSDLAKANADNLYDAILKLRSEWLTSRGATSVSDATPTGVDVYMNGTLLGKADYLRGLRVQDVTSVTYWNAGQASARFGMGHPRGVLELIR